MWEPFHLVLPFRGKPDFFFSLYNLGRFFAAASCEVQASFPPPRGSLQPPSAWSMVRAGLGVSHASPLNHTPHLFLP